MINILVITPYGRYCNLQSAEKTVMQLHESKKYKITWGKREGTFIYDNRNGIINGGKCHAQYQNPQPGKYDYALCLDSDIESLNTEADIDKLIEADKHIISGAYPYREKATSIVAGYWTTAPGFVDTLHSAKQKPDVMRVDWCGAGFLLVKWEVFQNIEYPWFRHELVNDGTNYMQTGEDVGFCLNLQRHGYNVYLHTGVSLTHNY